MTVSPTSSTPAPLPTTTEVQLAKCTSSQIQTIAQQLNFKHCRITGSYFYKVEKETAFGTLEYSLVIHYEKGLSLEVWDTSPGNRFQVWSKFFNYTQNLVESLTKGSWMKELDPQIQRCFLPTE